MKRAAAIAILATAFLWFADLGWGAVATALAPDDPVGWPPLGRVVTQATLFAALMAIFVDPQASPRLTAGFGLLLGLFSWLPQNLFLFGRIPRLDWDPEIAAISIGLAVATAGQWALLGYLSGRASRFSR